MSQRKEGRRAVADGQVEIAQPPPWAGRGTERAGPTTTLPFMNNAAIPRVAVAFPLPWVVEHRYRREEAVLPIATQQLVLVRPLAAKRHRQAVGLQVREEGLEDTQGPP